FSFCMALRGPMVAKFVNAFVGVVATVGVYVLGRMVFTPSVGIWAAAFFYTMPLTSWLVGTAHSDLILALFIVAATIALLYWSRNRQTNWIVVTGMLAGSAVAVKLNAMYVAIGIGIAVCCLLLGGQESTVRKAWAVALLVISASLIAVPW